MRTRFPFFNQNTNDQEVIYLDSAATSQKLDKVISDTTSFYTACYAPVNRSTYPLANHASSAFEKTRFTVSQLINAAPTNIVFTSGATESINIIANGLSSKELNGTKVLVLASEHHANFIPWQVFCKKYGLQLEVIPVGKDGVWGREETNFLLSRLTCDVALIACAHVSNLLGNIYPISLICERAHAVNAVSVIDGTQAISHMKVDVQEIMCDFYVFSMHKMYGPTGVGILFGREKVLQALVPSKLGGEMVSDVDLDTFTMVQLPIRLEPGTSNLAGVICARPAAEFLQTHIDRIVSHEEQLYQYALNKMKAISGIKILGNLDTSVGIIAFTHVSLSALDIADWLYQKNIAIRSGSHCAIPLLKSLNINNCLRVSIACYNNLDDIDAFIQALITAIDKLKLDEEPYSMISKIETKQTLEYRLNLAKSWDDKHRQLMLFSKNLQPLDNKYQIDSYSVEGCETSVWIYFDKDSSQFFAHANTKIVKGILALLLEKANSLTKAQRVTFNFEQYLIDLGLLNYFSSGRKNGIGNVIRRLNSIV